MRRCPFMLAVSFACASIVAHAQTTLGQVPELRKQIDQLQQQLDKLETGDRKNSRVTDIGTQRMQPREVGYSLRLYDIGDLFAVAPTYEAHRLNDLQLQDQLLFPSPVSAAPATGVGGIGGGMGGGFFNVGPTPGRKLPEGAQHVAAAFAGTNGGAAQNVGGARTSIDDLVQAITSTIAPTSWSEVGGEGSIARLGNALLISAEPKTHEQIESLLTLFRQRWKTLRTVTVRAHWLWLSEPQLATLLPERAGDKSSYGVVDEVAWQKRPQPDPKQGSGYRAVLTCYNGQTVHVLAGGQTLAVTDIEVGTAKPANFVGAAVPTETICRPKLVALQDGAGLQVTPLVSSSGKYVVLDVHSRVAKIHGRPAAAPPVDAKPNPPGASPQEIVAAIDRPVVVAQRLSTTLRLPIDRFVLVGGMTFDGESPPSDVNLYLFIRASVQELVDETPLSEPAPQEKSKP